MTSKSKAKGDRGERDVVALFELHDIPAHKVPLSGAIKTAGGRYAGDVRFMVGDIEYSGEVKVRKNGFKMTYDWLEGVDALFHRSDRKDWLVTMRFEDLLDLIKGE